MEDRESIRRLGGELVLFFNASLELVQSWREHDDSLPEQIMVVADPQAELYQALGTHRSGSYLSLARGQLGPALTSALQGRLPKLTSADMLRLGADAAVAPDGEIALLHRARTPDDRLTLGELAGALG